MLHQRRLAWTGVIAALLAVETVHHARSLGVDRPTQDLDRPFQQGCSADLLTSSPRENATLFMLARNSDVEGAVASMRSLEESFNRHYHYPVLFVNNEPWSAEFVDALQATVSGDARFEVLNSSLWGFPDSIDQDHARSQMRKLEDDGIKYAGHESYHHMCRFNSGGFYDMAALQEYRYYWRVEPDVDFSCALTYDPFRKMREAQKVYGYTIALWELESTVTSLFRRVSEFKDAQRIPTTDLWRLAVEPSWLPQPLRWLAGRLSIRRAASGDHWNLCHYWSNFEIADLDFFRSEQYRRLFAALDRAGGFYYERWGDAAVHSLAAALFLAPEQVHYFEDIGYRHGDFENCPDNAAAALQRPESAELQGREWLADSESSAGVGCRCRCNPRAVPNRAVCVNKLRQGVESRDYRLSWWRRNRG